MKRVQNKSTDVKFRTLNRVNYSKQIIDRAYCKHDQSLSVDEVEDTETLPNCGWR